MNVPDGQYGYGAIEEGLYLVTCITYWWLKLGRGRRGGSGIKFGRVSLAAATPG